MTMDEKYVPLLEFLAFISIDEDIFWSWVRNGTIPVECFFSINGVTRVLQSKAMESLYVASDHESEEAEEAEEALALNFDFESIKRVISAHKIQVEKLENIVESNRFRNEKIISLQKAESRALKKFNGARASALDTLNWAADKSRPEVREAINDSVGELFDAYEPFFRIVELSDEIIQLSRDITSDLDKSLQIQRITIELLDGLIHQSHK